MYSTHLFCRWCTAHIYSGGCVLHTFYFRSNCLWISGNLYYFLHLFRQSLCWSSQMLHYKRCVSFTNDIHLLSTKVQRSWTSKVKFCVYAPWRNTVRTGVVRSVLNKALYDGIWSDSRHGHFDNRKITPTISWITDWIYCTDSMDNVEKYKPCHFLNPTPISLLSKPQLSHCIDWAIPALTAVWNET